MIEPVTLTLYFREGCHLCDEMLQALMSLQPSLTFELQQIDVDDDPLLARRYNELVPVLALEDEEICHHRLDEAQLKGFLASKRV